MINTTLIIVYILLLLASLLHVILYGKRPIRSLSWFLILIIIPFFGFLLYVLFGVSRRTDGLFKLKETKKRRAYDNKNSYVKKRSSPIDFQDLKNIKLTKLLKTSSGFPAFSGNKVVVFNDGVQTFDTIFSTIKSAKKFVHIQYYIFEEGTLLERLFKILKQKIEEGIEVRILYDAIGSYELTKKMIQRFKNIGAQIFTTMSLSYGSFIFTLNYRNHRKIVVVDGIIGFTGGFNVSDKYINRDNVMGKWDDTHAMINGPAVDSLHRVFIKDFYFASKEKEFLLKDTYLPEQKKEGEVAVQIVSGGPDAIHPAIMQQYITMINLADEYIYISNPYFIPNSALFEALKIAKLSGVQVKVLVPKQSDSWLAKNSMFANFEELLSIGVEIYLQETAFLHSKLIVMDGEIVSIGSGNFDHRSFEHNFETNSLIFDKEITDNVCQTFIDSCKNGIKLEYESYKNRPFQQKFSQGIARFFSPLL